MSDKTWNRLVDVVKLLLVAGAIVGVQIKNAMTVDRDEAVRSTESIVGVLGILGAAGLIKRKGDGA